MSVTNCITPFNHSTHRIAPYSRIIIKRSGNQRPLNKVIDRIGCTLFGDVCIQSFTAFFVWEKVFAELEYKFARLIELGSGLGGTSVFFSLMCVQCEAAYHGYERFGRRRNAHRNSELKRLLQLETHMHYEDIFEEPVHSDLKSLIAAPGCTVLFCDNGDKVHEFRTFAPLLKVGDIIASHDWPKTIRFDLVAKTIENCGLQQMMVEDCAALQTHTAWFRKVA